MPGSILIDGQSRKTLISRVTSQATQGSSVDFGQVDTRLFSRFVGFVHPGTGSVTLRIRSAITSGGPWSVSSTQVCSTVTVVDVVNVSKFSNFAFSAVQSTALYTIGIMGEPTR